MKTLLNKILNKIVKYRKKLVYSFFAMIVWQVFLFNIGWVWFNTNVYAADGNSNTATQNQTFQQYANDLIKKIRFYSSFCYIILYPLLYLAGSLVDNSFIYGASFWFDVILWKLWNISKNLANFTLWFLFIYEIFLWLIKENSVWQRLKKILVSSLVAWLWIQASWFAIAALIDLSTVATYGVGWLPLSVLNAEEKKVEIYVPKMAITSDLNGDKSSADDYIPVNIYFVWEKDWSPFYISPCATAKSWSTTYIIWPKLVYYSEWQWNSPVSVEKNSCNYEWQVYYFTLHSDLDKDRWNIWSDLSEVKKNQVRYVSEMATFKQNFNPEQKWLGENIVEYWYEMEDWWTIWMDLGNKNKKQNFTYIWDLVKKTESYLWVFSSLYNSLINSTSGWIVNADNKSTYTNLLEILFTFWHCFALVLPLAAMVVALLIRIFVIWVAIILSPFIVLCYAFTEIGVEDKNFSFLDKIPEIWSYLKLWNLCKLIFSPVVICLAVSLSCVVVNIMTTQIESQIITHWMDLFGWYFWDLIKINIQWVTVNFVKLLFALFWVAITWVLVWAAVTSWAFKDWIMKKIKESANNFIQSYPVVPIPQYKEDWTFNWFASVWFKSVLWSDSSLAQKIMSKTFDNLNDGGQEDIINNLINRPDEGNAPNSSDKESIWWDGLDNNENDK